jgi:hypothetical protein
MASAACKFGFLDLEVITELKLFIIVVSSPEPTAWKASPFRAIRPPPNEREAPRRIRLKTIFFNKPSPAAAKKMEHMPLGYFAGLSSSRPRRPSQLGIVKGENGMTM